MKMWRIWNILQKVAIVTGGISIVYFAMQLARYNSTFSSEYLMPYMKEMVIVLLISIFTLGISTYLKNRTKK